jgi:hypothetical protein
MNPDVRLMTLMANPAQALNGVSSGQMPLEPRLHPAHDAQYLPL